MGSPSLRLTLLTALAFGLAGQAVPVRGQTPPSPHPLTLAEAKAIALRNHPRYAAAQLQAFFAEQQVRETRAAYLPAANGYIDAVGATTEGTRILAGALNNPTIYDRMAGGVGLSQLITDFGRTTNLIASAKDQARGAAAAAEATREQILLNAETSYYAALQAQSVLDVARQTLASRELVLKQVRALEENKLKSSLDVSFAQVALEQADLLVQQAEGELQSTQAALSTALGYPNEQTFVLLDHPGPAAPPPAVELLIANALKNRPDLRQLRDSRDAALRIARAERDANYPTLSAVGDAGTAVQRDPHLPPNYAVGGVQLTIPLFAGGSYIARQREAELQARVADESLREAEDNTARDVRVAWIGVGTALQRLRTTDQLVVHANEAFDLARARYQVGSSSVVELSDAQLSQTAAAIDQVNARYDTLIDQAVLDYQTGAID